MFSVNSYAKIWEIKNISDNYSDVRISTSKKDKDSGEYSQDFGDTVRLVGQAHEQMKYMSEGDKFKILRCGVTNKWDKEKKRMYVNYVIFEVEFEDPAEFPKASDENPFL